MSADTTPAPAATPDRLMEIAFAFAPARALLSAVELGLFTRLAASPATLADLTRDLGIHPRAAADFLDTLVTLKILERDGAGVYSNAPDAAAFLDRNQPAYIGGMLEMAGKRLYKFWGALTEALQTGEPQNETKGDPEVFKKMYADPERLAGFLRAMTGISAGPARAIAAKFDFRPYRTFCDVGCAEGATPVQLALAHPHLTGRGADLAPVKPLFEEYVRQHELASRVEFTECNFFEQPLPSADVLVMGHILHDWGMEHKQMLLKKAYAALPPGGALIVYDAMIDDDRRKHLGGLLMSLNMLIETPAGFDYTIGQCQAWFRDAGFKNVRATHLVGAEWMVTGHK